MGKTTVKTKKNTYTKDGKVYEDEIVTTVVETDEGTKTSIQTTTRGPLGDADTFDFSKVKESLSKDRKSRSRSSSSSSDSDDGKKSKSKSEGGGAKGLLGKFKSKSKSKKDDSSDSDDEKKKHHKEGGSKGLLGKFKSKSKKDDSSDSDDDKKKHSSGGGAKGLLGKLKSKSKSGHSSDSDDSSDDEDFAKAAHKEMNVIRKKHCVDKLKLSKEMCKYAKEWAVKMAKEDQMSIRPDGKYGENIFCVSSNSNKFKVEAKTVIDKWHSESVDHTFGKEPEGTTLKTGHFTQMVWKDTKQVGVAKARSASGLKVFVVANFDPKGNYKGQFSEQVPPAGGFPKRRDSSSSSSSSDSSSDEEDFVEDCIKSHNDYRKNHGVQPLKKSKKLNKHAKEWAKTIAKKDNMEQRPKNEYGENIYCVWSSNPKHKIKGNEAVDSWYSEVKDFDFGKEPTDLKHGHFTQIVWEDSKEIGVGTARSKSGKIYVVANYSPAGNYVGSFASKVHNVK